MSSGPETTTAFNNSGQQLLPPAAPLAMPEQSIERPRRMQGFFGLFALFLFPAK